MAPVFTFDVFVICFRESLEAAIIISVLLSFTKQSFGAPGMDRKAYHRLLWHIWIGSILGILICLAIGGGFIGAYYAYGTDIWGNSEELWEGVLSVIASVMITVMGLGMLRINKMQAKWRVKIARAILEGEEDENGEPIKEKWYKKLNPKRYNPLNLRFNSLGRWGRKYALFILPFITTLREGVEAVVFVGGVGLGKPVRAFPLSVITGLLCGFLSGFLIYKAGNIMSLRWFLICSTCFLYLIASGLFSRSVWDFQMQVYNSKTGGDAAENGAGPGSYNIRWSVWHVNCCNPERNDNGWGIFNALFGWQNSATYGSVLSYNAYWIFMMLLITMLKYEEKTGQFPIIGRFWQRKRISQEEADRLYERAQEHVRMMNPAVEGADGAVIEKRVSSTDSSEGHQGSKKNALVLEQQV